MTFEPERSTTQDEGAREAPSSESEQASLEEELERARTRADELHDKLLRVAADFDNYRKRVARDAEAQRTRATESLVGELLPVLDNLERALDASEHHQEAKVAEGVRLVQQQLVGLLRKRGLEEIEAGVGTRFDPHCHEALSQQPSEQPEGAIAAVWQRGYRLGDRVVRAARVAVSSGPPADGTDPAGEAEAARER